MDLEELLRELAVENEPFHDSHKTIGGEFPDLKIASHLQGNSIEVEPTSPEAPSHDSHETPPGSLREQIEDLLSGGPVPFEEIQSRTGASDDELREAIRPWPELIAFDASGVWTWEIKRNPLTWRGGLPKIPKKRHAEGLFGMFPERGSHENRD